MLIRTSAQSHYSSSTTISPSAHFLSSSAKISVFRDRVAYKKLLSLSVGLVGSRCSAQALFTPLLTLCSLNSSALYSISTASFSLIEISEFSVESSIYVTRLIIVAQALQLLLRLFTICSVSAEVSLRLFNLFAHTQSPFWVMLSFVKYVFSTVVFPL